jgi:hypothetical protein
LTLFALSSLSPPSARHPRLLFEVRPAALRLHLPDTRMLVDGLPSASDRAAARHLVTPARPQQPRRLLRDLLAARQPPGLRARAVARLARLMRRLVWSAALVAAGYMVGAYRGC